MNPAVNRLKIVLIVLLLAASGASLIYHVGWRWPRQACESKGSWWDDKGRACAKPVLISDITGRTIQDKAAEAQAKAAIGRVDPPSKSAPAP
jgi:hypothetical protein